MSTMGKGRYPAQHSSTFKTDLMTMKPLYQMLSVGLITLMLAPVAVGQVGLTPDTEVETQKRAQTGMKFLSMSVDARAAAIGSAMAAELQGNSTSMFYNPASMGFMDGKVHAAGGNLGFIADINYQQASVAFKPSGRNLGVFGVSFVNVDYGEFKGTIRSNNEQGFIDTGDYSPDAMSVGLGYARSFSDRFAAGANFKYAFQDLGSDFATSQDFDSGAIQSMENYSNGTVAFDFGIVYATGFRSLVIGMSARNFAQELTYVRERFELPLTFQIGMALNLFDLAAFANPDVHSLNLHLDAQRPRDFDEHVRVGLEYSLSGIVYVRGGLEQATASEEQGFSAGGGLRYTLSSVRMGVDYAYTDFGIFGSVNRFAIQVGM